MSLIRCPHCGELHELKIYSAYDLGDRMDIKHTTVRYHARVHNIGTKVDRQWVFTEHDMELMEAIPGPGRRPWKHKVDEADDDDTDDPMPE